MLDAAAPVFLVQDLPEIRASDYPSTIEVHGNDLQLHYRFDATVPDDGVTLDVPLPPHLRALLVAALVEEVVA